MNEEIRNNLSSDNIRITVLTGAGISAESGIPTFRGPEGYWTIGSREYQPQEMATYRMFTQKPEEVWKWYLYRLGICRNAKPNRGHKILVEMEETLEDRFRLITQNVDGLHLIAGNSTGRTFQIHGNIAFMRCSDECKNILYKLPDELLFREVNKTFSSRDVDLLSCPDCGKLTRPHVLWFDECYDENYFKFETSIRTAYETDILIIAGTSGATTLPNQIALIVYNNGKTIIDINIEENPFTELAVSSNKGCFLKMSCSEGLEKINKIIN